MLVGKDLVCAETVTGAGSQAVNGAVASLSWSPRGGSEVLKEETAWRQVTLSCYDSGQLNQNLEPKPGSGVEQERPLGEPESWTGQ